MVYSSLMRRSGRAVVQFILIAALMAAQASAWAGGSSEASVAGAGGPPKAGAAATSAAAVSSTLPGVAVVELFTSEGCSSCPPADKVLASLVARSRASGAQVYALAWHVDYWDYLGWKDPYASKAATERQRRYAAAFSSGLYTPQIVVNGRRVASSAGDSSTVEGLAQHQLRRPAQASLQLTVRRGSSARSLLVRVEAAGGPPRGVVTVALVEDGLVQRPTAGENAGRTLRHTHVVRAFATLAFPGGTTAIDLPPGVSLAESRVIVYVQDPVTLSIVGANAVGLSTLASTAAAATRVVGQVFDSTGGGVAGALVQACSDNLCVPAASDQAGRYLLKGIPPGRYLVKLHPPADAGQRIVSLPLDVQSGDDISLPAVTLGS